MGEAARKKWYRLPWLIRCSLVLLLADAAIIGKLPVPTGGTHCVFPLPVRLSQAGSAFAVEEDETRPAALTLMVYRPRTFEYGLWAPTERCTQYQLFDFGNGSLTSANVVPVLRAIDSHFTADPDMAHSPWHTTVRTVLAGLLRSPGSFNLTQENARILHAGYLHDSFATVVLSGAILAVGCRMRDDRRRRAAEVREARGLCPGCGYDLTGLRDPVCPECGTVQYTVESAGTDAAGSFKPVCTHRDRASP